MKVSVKSVLFGVLIGILALMIPASLCVYAYQSHRYTQLLKEVKNLEKTQEVLIEENKKLVSDISTLTNADRIEKIATEELGMHKSSSEDIYRVEITGERK